METAIRMKSTNIRESTDNNKKKDFLTYLLPPVHQVVHATTVPVSFLTLPILIDELWNTFTRIGGEKFGSCNKEPNKNIFKKVMLTLAEAKVCCAQRAFPHNMHVDLPQKDLYFEQELLKLNLLAKKLPYPLAMYLDCLGNTVEGKLHIIPVLAKLMTGPSAIASTISGGPKQLPQLIQLLRDGVKIGDEVYEAAKELEAFPKFRVWHNNNQVTAFFGQEVTDFWGSWNGTIEISDNEIETFQQIVNCFDNKNFNTETDLFKGQGTMAQTVQTPKWTIDGRFRYFCMMDISECDQKLGATFGFRYTASKTVQKSRYDGSSEIAYWRGEVSPREMLKSLLDETSKYTEEFD